MLLAVVKKWLSLGRAFLGLLKALIGGLKTLAFYGFMAFFPLVVLWATIGFITDALEFRDDDPSRGAAAIVNDPIDPDVAKDNISYLSQNWSASDSLWFYQSTQGSNLIPFDFFMHLEQANSQASFRDNEHINAFRYLPQDRTTSNPDALPVGVTKDVYQGEEYIGFTCSACHTSQINYQLGGVNKAIRLDGAPAASDMEGFIKAMASALETTLNDQSKFERFANNLNKTSDKEKAELQEDLVYYAVKLRNYAQMNEPLNSQGGSTHYGFARLDAFGRIYNRVLQFVIDPQTLRAALQSSLPQPLWLKAKSDIDRVLQDQKDQTDLLIRTMVAVEKHRDSSISQAQWQASVTKLRASLFNNANAPASYPYLWDIAQHDFVQWTGLVSNAGVGNLGRNVGQVIGVFATLDWQPKAAFSLRQFLGLWHEPKDEVEFKTSIDKRNLSRVEHHLRKLQSPAWPEEFPALDQVKVAAGEKIFDQRCASCHENINPRDPGRRIVANITSTDRIQTDSVLADNSVNYKGASGLLKDKYVETTVGDVLIEREQPIAALVRYTSRKVIGSVDPDVNVVRGRIEWAWDLLKTLGDNEIKPTIRKGNYHPATTAKPYEHIRSYKARALNGIWATAPYLHNGSVANLYELLLPKRRPGDPEFDDQGNKLEYRRDVFYVGSRQFDFDGVGFNSQPHENAFRFDTSLPGNSNAGHEYAAGHTADGEGKRFAALTKAQRLELLEYLKSL